MKKILLRTDSCLHKYINDRANRDNESHTLDNPDDIVVKEYMYWKIIENKYPYDAIASVHDMLVPKRIFGALTEANADEQSEYNSILNTLEQEQKYDAMQINFSKGRSIGTHFHLHLLTWKEV